VLPELIEAAARSGEPELAGVALERLTESTRLSTTEWARGIEARSRGLLTEGQAAEDLYRTAIEQLASSRVVVELARAHLVYGEWLRREKRRADARDQLRTAYDMFDEMGAAAFGDRARRELLAAGEAVGKRSVETRDELTPQEAHIAGLARDGYSNQEIGAQLYISPRTVEWHLRKVFRKLDIGARNQLRDALPRSAGATVPA
jgi:ATP/maltotriose-dependent transcriptional regulator MalT